METPPLPPGLAEAFRRGGALGRQMAEHDWSGSPLGPPAGWPAPLQSSVGQLLASQAEIVLFWGPDLCALYNDAYAPTIGVKHPVALGRPAREGWAELWDDLGPLLHGVLETGDGFGARDRPFLIDRRGFLERVFFDVSYDPVRGEGGRVEGVFCIVTETTRRVLVERRLQAVRRLTDRLAGQDEAGVCAAAVEELVSGDEDADATFAQVHVAGRRGLRLCATAGAPEPQEEVVAGAIEQVLDGEVVRLPAADLTPAPPPFCGEEAVAVPLRAGGRVLGALVAGPSRHLATDGELLEHLQGAAERLARAIADVRQQEEERRRAATARRVAERQRHIATVLQRAILPDRLPLLDGMAMAARYLPGDGALEVGGDWYDAFEVRPGVLALAVGDVVGRGVEAAASMAQLRNGLRAYLAEESGPAAALAQLRGLADSLGVDFCTVACLEVDLGEGALRSALAGHPPPLLLDGAGGHAWLRGGRSAPIGVDLRPAAVAEQERELAPGETVVLYTDGLVERRDRSITDGLDALAALAVQEGPAGPEALVGRLVEVLADREDDTAVVALQRAG